MSFTRRAFFSASSGVVVSSTLAHVGCSLGESSAWEKGVADIDRRLPELMKSLHVPGVSLAFIRDARIAWSKSFGIRDVTSGAPVDEDTLFSAQSMSKPVFAYRVMKLVEQGVLELDAPLTKYTPDVFVEGDPRLREITARRVLSHTTGLPNWRKKEDPLRINFAPGSKWSYSGEGYHYLQTVVSRLTGHIDQTQCRNFEMDYRVCATDFGEYMEAHVLRPFGMKRSGYVSSAEMEKDIALRHDKEGKAMPKTTSSAIDVARYGSAGSLMTTAADYSKFLIEVMQPKPADEYRLNAASRAEMLKPQIEIPFPFKAHWALGWQVWHLDLGDLIAHGGDDEGWHSQSAFSPDRKTGFVILTNGEGGQSLIWDQLLKPLVSVVFA
jgi:CubicO group peptidase (beta-lactamase class C family)